MMPMNNPMMMILNAARNGGNPMTIMQQLAGQNPQAAQAMKMIQGKNPQQLRSTAENMAKERGVTLSEVAQRYGLQIPK